MITRRTVAAGGLAAAVSIAAPFIRVASAQTGTTKAGPLKVGSVKFGSLNWLIETIRAEGIDRKVGLEFAPVELSNNHAGPISLLSGGSDVIVSDWPWALRQRGLGEALKFAPYSTSLGSLVVPAQSPIKTIADLAGQRVGVAGSSIDKSWLLMQAYARKVANIDLAAQATIIYGAPPLLAEQAVDGRLDANLNFWTQTVRLKSAGFRDVVTMLDVFEALAIKPIPAFVGFIWKEANPKAAQVTALLEAVREGNALLATSDAAWERIKPLMKVTSDAEFEGLRRAYLAGIPPPWSAAETVSAEKILNALINNGGTELIGSATKFDPQLFHVASG